MSAYVVAREHIDLLVRLALEGPAGVAVGPDGVWYVPSYLPVTSPDALGQMLADACFASVAYRYRESDPGDLPGPVDRYYLEPYTYRRPVHRLTVAEALKALDGYEYQSCEHPDWPTSEAAKACDTIRRALCHRVPGYSPAPWTWDASDLAGLVS